MIASTRDRAAAISLGILLVLAYFVFGRIFEIRPFSGDNLRILFWADEAIPSALLRADANVYPEWRPLAYLTVWLQYRWSQTSHLHVFYAVNLLLWIGCAWLVYHVARRLTHSSAAALFGAALVFTDFRAIGPVTMMERANLLACLFGLGALVIATGAWYEPLTRLRWVGLAVLLLASSLSKEYGLAFMGALAVWSLLERRRDTLAAAVAAGAMYALLRITFANGALAPYCEDTGYFFGMRSVCFDGIRSVATTQTAYNIVATAIGSVLPGLFTIWGEVSIAPLWLARSVVWLALAALGCWKGPRPVRITVLVIASNAALSFMLYRSRNHLVALCALGIAVGAGVAVLNGLLQTWGRPRLMRYAGVTALLGLLMVEAIRTREIVSADVADSRRMDPCEALADRRPLDRAFVKRIKTAYAMLNPDCVRDNR